MSFFDSTPIGRIVNRFARDIEVVDFDLPQDVRIWIHQLLQLAAILFVICFNLHLFILVVIPTGAVYYVIQLLYISTSRQLRRLESISRSPIFSHFGETLQGSAVIRAYAKTPEFIKESNDKIDFNQMCYFPQIAANRWLGIRLDLCASTVTFATSLFVVLARGDIDAGIAGLCLAYALQATGNLNALIRLSADVEVNIVSVERIAEYIALDSEDHWVRNSPRHGWPTKGVVEFKNYSTRYREGLPCVVRGINLKINAGEKVGICGRTGAGKSSLTLALFRIIEACEGKIIIDDISIGEIGLHDLRKKLSIIPQDPVLFSGALRLNLDPFGSYTDDQLWHAIEHAHLKSFVCQQDKGLDFTVTEGGENLSVGQRQLVCLARALLRQSKILILDEATAAVDVVTDALIQETIQTEFANCTIITIAHRINTIINYDKILVLDGGEIREFDSPQNLLANPNSLFSAIVEDSKSK